MIKNNYLEELGVESSTPKIRWSYALVILAVLTAAVVWLAVVEIKADRHPPGAINAAARVVRPAPPGSVPAAAPHTRPHSPVHGLS